MTTLTMRTNPAEHLRDILRDPAPELFFSRNDSSDPRMGDLVLRKLEAYVPEVRVGILGVPQDEGVRRNKGRIGSRQAPTEIRRSLYKLTSFSPENETRDISELRIFDFGDVSQGDSLEETHERLEYAVETLMNHNIFPIVLGGGHDITYPGARGFAKNALSVGVVSFDAHLDYRKPIPQRNSGTSFRQMLDDRECKIAPCNLVEIGLQPFANSAEHFRDLKKRGAYLFSIEQTRRKTIEQVAHDALRMASHATDRVLASFDLDCVRSADAPGVSAASPEGFTAEELLNAASIVGRNSAVKMIDVAEVNPMYDDDGRTVKLAALLIMRVLAGLLER